MVQRTALNELIVWVNAIPAPIPEVCAPEFLMLAMYFAVAPSDVFAPTTVNLPAADVVPTSKLPLESILAASAPPSVKAIVSAAGKNMPVFVSPVVVIAGSAAEPAENVATPVALSVPVTERPVEEILIVGVVYVLPPTAVDAATFKVPELVTPLSIT
jgi:hypothetical protein